VGGALVGFIATEAGFVSPLPAPEIAEVTALTLEGSGVLRPAGKLVLVPGALAGEEVAFQRKRRRRNYDEGVLVEVRRVSPDRVEPGCAYFGTCGGCSLQHLSSDAQLAMKQATLLDNLARIADLIPAQVLPPVRGAVWGYRRKARLAVRHVEKKGRVLVGFRESAKPWVADMLRCETVEPAISRLIEPLSGLIGSLSIRARLPQVEATAADNATALVLRVLEAPTVADHEQLLSFSRTHGVRLYLQPGNPSSVIDVDPAQAGEELHYRIPDFDINLTFGPTDFIQVHGEVNRLMIDQAIRLMAPASTDRVLDLYCGIGNFTLPLARRAGEVVGLEGAATAVNRGRHNAGLAGIGNARFVEADLAGAGTEGAWTREHFDHVLLDPPRTGAAELLPALGKLAARRIVYVSCHPGTLARDAAVLVREHGYRLACAGVMDMFPHTSHVESMALFERP
jgi:23S rRNA (uracil1939-C5)-methyltransferase